MELANVTHNCTVFEESHLSTCRVLPSAREQVQDVTPIGCKRKISESELLACVMCRVQASLVWDGIALVTTAHVLNMARSGLQQQHSMRHEIKKVVFVTQGACARTGSYPPRGSLGTQVDSTSLRTPVTLKSLSTAYHKRRSVDTKGASCNTIPDTCSTASRPGNKAARAERSVEDDDQGELPQEQQERPVPCTKHTEEQIVAAGNCLTVSRAQHSSEVGPHESDSAGGAASACHTADTSRVLFTSPQASVGLFAASTSPTGGECQGLGTTTECPQPKPSQPTSPRELTESEQQFLLTQDLDEGAQPSFEAFYHMLQEVVHRTPL